MNNFKKVIAAGLAVSMLASLASCGKKVADVSDDEKMTITWLGYPINPLSEEGSYVEKLLEEKFNVEIKPIFLDSTNYRDKKALLASGGEIPDLIYELDPSDVQTDAEHGIICEVPYETIKEYAPTVVKNLNDVAKEAWLYSNVDGDNYGIPNVAYSNRPVVGVWRTDWLKNVGIDKIPETLDEMHDALYKFTHNDPDGNGVDDTYGMTGDITAWQMMFDEVFGAYGSLPFNWMEKDGEVKYGGLTDGTVKGLETLSQWYSEGLIHPDFITDSSWSTGAERFKSGKVGYSNALGGWWNTASETSLPNVVAKLNEGGTVASSGTITGPDGEGFVHSWGKAAHVVAFGNHISEQPNKLKRILEMLEYMVTDEEFFIKAKRGEQGVHWDFADADKGYEGGVVMLTPYDDANQQEKECIKLNIESPSFFVPVSPSFEIVKKYSFKDEIEGMEKYRSADLGKTDYFGKPDILPSAGNYLTNLRTQQINLMVKAIKGEITADEYAAQFEEIWNSQGGKTLEKEAAEMAETKNEILKMVEND